MKIDKIAQKRALAEYKGKQDYERLLKSYWKRDEQCRRAFDKAKRLDAELEESKATNCRLVAAVIALGGLLLVATCCVGLLAWGCK